MSKVHLVARPWWGRLAALQPFARLVLLGLLVVLVVGCAARRDLLADRESSEAAAKAETEALAALPVDSALLSIARARDARRDARDVERLSRHPNPEIRAEALRALGLIGDPSSLPVLLAGLDDTAEQVRAMAAFALSQHWAWPLAELEARTTAATIELSLCSALEREVEDYGADSPVLAAQVRALAEFGVGDPSVDALLWSLLEDGAGGAQLIGSLLRTLAVQGKAERAQPLTVTRVERLSELLRGGDVPSPWRIAYLFAYSRFAQDAVLPAEQLLLSLLDSDKDGQLNCWALRALGRVAGPAAADTLLANLQSDSGSRRTRLCAVRGAASLGQPGLAVLDAALADPEPMVSVEAGHALGRLGEAGYGLLERWLEPPQRLGGRLAAARLSGLEGLLSSAEEELPAWLTTALPQLLGEAQQALESADIQLREVAYGLLAVHPSAEAVATLLARIPLEQDASAGIALTLAVATRTELAVEGSLVTWLLGDDPVLAAIAAESLTTRPGEHITAKLLASWRDFPGPEQVDRRQAAAKALATREGVPAEVLADLLEDPEALVRMEAFMGPSGRGLRAGTAAAPQERDYPLIEDAQFGMAGVRSATIETDRGAIKVAFLPNIAPAAVANFVHLSEQGFYSGLIFHRVVSDFVIQAGDPSGTGWGGPGHTLRDEFSTLPFGRGTMGMARAGKDTAGSQWFITHSPQPQLEGRYTIFAQVLSGLDVLDAIVQGDSIRSVTIER